MKNMCFDEIAIQTFLDGELPQTEAELISQHARVCEPCTKLLREIESENEFAFGVLDRNLNFSVPSEKIRERVFASVEKRRRTNFFGNIWTSLFAFSRTYAAVAGAIALVAIGYSGLQLYDDFAYPYFFAMDSSGETEKPGAPIKDPVLRNGIAPEIAEIAGSGTNAFPSSNHVVISQTRAKLIARSGASGTGRISVRENSRMQNRDAKSRGAHRESLPSAEDSAEQTYLRTIATLSESVDKNKDEVLRPSTRVGYERDLALVDNAIAKMRKEVERNPKNQGAREVLYSSYQNKIDLMSSVAQKSELVASIR
jgi:hypothetical protein